MSVYEKLAKVRDMVSLNDDPIIWEYRAYTLGQIADQCLTNEKRRDDFPDYLFIEHIHLNEEELKELLLQLELKVSSIEKVADNGWVRDYEIYLEPKTKE